MFEQYPTAAEAKRHAAEYAEPLDRLINPDEAREAVTAGLFDGMMPDSAKEVAARHLREAGCTNVRIEDEECTERRYMGDDEEYVRTEVIGEMPEEEWLNE